MLQTSAKQRVIGAALAITSLTLIGYAYASWPAPEQRQPSVIVSPPRDPRIDEGLDRSPRARWRLAPTSELGRVVLFASHILVRHDKSEKGEAPFSAPDWNTQPPPPPRTRAEALKLVRELAARAQRDPQSFAQLARDHSEDLLTRDRGGALGPRSPVHFMMQQGMLDALDALEHGQVSGVLETSYGFHVFQRHAPPAELELSARHVVIGHDETPWLEDHRRTGFATKRTRAAARERARSLREQLIAIKDVTARHEAFAAAIQQHSEHRDAARDGDLGVWSTREDSRVRWQLAAIEEVPIGGIAGPVETPDGFELVERTAVTPRERFAIEAIRMPANPDAEPDDPYAFAKVEQRARSIAALLSEDPTRFAAWQKEYCCLQPDTWTDGRGDQALTEVVRALPIGGVATQGVHVAPNIVIAKRIAPYELPPPLYDLPSPSEPDLERLVTGASGAGLASYVTALPKKLEASGLRIPATQRSAVDTAHENLAATLKAVPAEERIAALHAAQLELERILGGEQYQSYMAAVRAEVTALQMAAWH